MSTSETFTQHTHALNDIIERFRQDALPLEESLTLFEEGVRHIKASQALLNQAKGRFQSIQDALEEDNKQV
jgi:exodeoxyribonuclease VII small subunit